MGGGESGAQSYVVQQSTTALDIFSHFANEQ